MFLFQVDGTGGGSGRNRPTVDTSSSSVSSHTTTSDPQTASASRRATPHPQASGVVQNAGEVLHRINGRVHGQNQTQSSNFSLQNMAAQTPAFQRSSMQALGPSRESNYSVTELMQKLRTAPNQERRQFVMRQIRTRVEPHIRSVNAGDNSIRRGTLILVEDRILRNQNLDPTQMQGLERLLHWAEGRERESRVVTEGIPHAQNLWYAYESYQLAHEPAPAARILNQLAQELRNHARPGTEGDNQQLSAVDRNALLIRVIRAKVSLRNFEGINFQMGDLRANIQQEWARGSVEGRWEAHALLTEYTQLRREIRQNTSPAVFNTLMIDDPHPADESLRTHLPAHMNLSGMTQSLQTENAQTANISARVAHHLQLSRAHDAMGNQVDALSSVGEAEDILRRDHQPNSLIRGVVLQAYHQAHLDEFISGRVQGWLQADERQGQHRTPQQRYAMLQDWASLASGLEEVGASAPAHEVMNHVQAQVSRFSVSAQASLYNQLFDDLSRSQNGHGLSDELKNTVLTSLHDQLSNPRASFRDHLAVRELLIAHSSNAAWIHESVLDLQSIANAHVSEDRELLPLQATMIRGLLRERGILEQGRIARQARGEDVQADYQQATALTTQARHLIAEYRSNLISAREGLSDPHSSLNREGRGAEIINTHYQQLITLTVQANSTFVNDDLQEQLSFARGERVPGRAPDFRAQTIYTEYQGFLNSLPAPQRVEGLVQTMQGLAERGDSIRLRDVFVPMLQQTLSGLPENLRVRALIQLSPSLGELRQRLEAQAERTRPGYGNTAAHEVLQHRDEVAHLEEGLWTDLRTHSDSPALQEFAHSMIEMTRGHSETSRQILQALLQNASTLNASDPSTQMILQVARSAIGGDVQARTERILRVIDGLASAREAAWTAEGHTGEMAAIHHIRQDLPRFLSTLPYNRLPQTFEEALRLYSEASPENARWAHQFEGAISRIPLQHIGRDGHREGSVWNLIRALNHMESPENIRNALSQLREVVHDDISWDTMSEEGRGDLQIPLQDVAAMLLDATPHSETSLRNEIAQLQHEIPGLEEYGHWKRETFNYRTALECAMMAAAGYGAGIVAAEIVGGLFTEEAAALSARALASSMLGEGAAAEEISMMAQIVGPRFGFQAGQYVTRTLVHSLAFNTFNSVTPMMLGQNSEGNLGRSSLDMAADTAINNLLMMPIAGSLPVPRSMLGRILLGTMHHAQTAATFRIAQNIRYQSVLQTARLTSHYQSLENRLTEMERLYRVTGNATYQTRAEEVRREIEHISGHPPDNSLHSLLGDFLRNVGQGVAEHSMGLSHAQGAHEQRSPEEINRMREATVEASVSARHEREADHLFGPHGERRVEIERAGRERFAEGGVEARRIRDSVRSEVEAEVEREGIPHEGTYRGVDRESYVRSRTEERYHARLEGERESWMRGREVEARTNYVENHPERNQESLFFHSLAEQGVFEHFNPSQVTAVLSQAERVRPSSERNASHPFPLRSEANRSYVRSLFENIHPENLNRHALNPTQALHSAQAAADLIHPTSVSGERSPENLRAADHFLRTAPTESLRNPEHFVSQVQEARATLQNPSLQARLSGLTADQALIVLLHSDLHESSGGIIRREISVAEAAQQLLRGELRLRPRTEQERARVSSEVWNSREALAADQQFIAERVPENERPPAPREHRGVTLTPGQTTVMPGYNLRTPSPRPQNPVYSFGLSPNATPLESSRVERPASESLGFTNEVSEGHDERGGGNERGGEGDTQGQSRDGSQQGQHEQNQENRPGHQPQADTQSGIHLNVGAMPEAGAAPLAAPESGVNAPGTRPGSDARHQPRAEGMGEIPGLEVGAPLAAPLRGNSPLQQEQAFAGHVNDGEVRIEGPAAEILQAGEKDSNKTTRGGPSRTNSSAPEEFAIPRDDASTRRPPNIQLIDQTAEACVDLMNHMGEIDMNSALAAVERMAARMETSDRGLSERVRADLAIARDQHREGSVERLEAIQRLNGEFERIQNLAREFQNQAANAPAPEPSVGATAPAIPRRMANLPPEDGTHLRAEETRVERSPGHALLPPETTGSSRDESFAGSVARQINSALPETQQTREQMAQNPTQLGAAYKAAINNHLSALLSNHEMDIEEGIDPTESRNQIINAMVEIAQALAHNELQSDANFRDPFLTTLFTGHIPADRAYRNARQHVTDAVLRERLGDEACGRLQEVERRFTLNPNPETHTAPQMSETAQFNARVLSGDVTALFEGDGVFYVDTLGNESMGGNAGANHLAINAHLDPHTGRIITIGNGQYTESARPAGAVSVTFRVLLPFASTSLMRLVMEYEVSRSGGTALPVGFAARAIQVTREAMRDRRIPQPLHPFLENLLREVEREPSRVGELFQARVVEVLDGGVHQESLAALVGAAVNTPPEFAARKGNVIDGRVRDVLPPTTIEREMAAHPNVLPVLRRAVSIVSETRSFLTALGNHFRDSIRALNAVRERAGDPRRQVKLDRLQSRLQSEMTEPLAMSRVFDSIFESRVGHHFSEFESSTRTDLPADTLEQINYFLREAVDLTTEAHEYSQLEDFRRAVLGLKDFIDTLPEAASSLDASGREVMANHLLAERSLTGMRYEGIRNLLNTPGVDAALLERLGLSLPLPTLGELRRRMLNPEQAGESGRANTRGTNTAFASPRMMDEHIPGLDHPDSMDPTARARERVEGTRSGLASIDSGQRDGGSTPIPHPMDAAQVIVRNRNREGQQFFIFRSSEDIPENPISSEQVHVMSVEIEGDHHVVRLRRANREEVSIEVDRELPIHVGETFHFVEFEHPGNVEAAAVRNIPAAEVRTLEQSVANVEWIQANGFMTSFLLRHLPVMPMVYALMSRGVSFETIQRGLARVGIRLGSLASDERMPAFRSLRERNTTLFAGRGAYRRAGMTQPVEAPSEAVVNGVRTLTNLISVLRGSPLQHILNRATRSEQGARGLSILMQPAVLQHLGDVLRQSGVRAPRRVTLALIEQVMSHAQSPEHAQELLNQYSVYFNSIREGVNRWAQSLATEAHQHDGYKDSVVDLLPSQSTIANLLADHFLEALVYNSASMEDANNILNGMNDRSLVIGNRYIQSIDRHVFSAQAAETTLVPGYVKNRVFQFLMLEPHPGLEFADQVAFARAVFDTLPPQEVDRFYAHVREVNSPSWFSTPMFQVLLERRGNVADGVWRDHISHLREYLQSPACSEAERARIHLLVSNLLPRVLTDPALASQSTLLSDMSVMLRSLFESGVTPLVRERCLEIIPHLETGSVEAGVWREFLERHRETDTSPFRARIDIALDRLGQTVPGEAVSDTPTTTRIRVETPHQEAERLRNEQAEREAGEDVVGAGSFRRDAETAPVRTRRRSDPGNGQAGFSTEGPLGTIGGGTMGFGLGVLGLKMGLGLAGAALFIPAALVGVAGAVVAVAGLSALNRIQTPREPVANRAHFSFENFAQSLVPLETRHDDGPWTLRLREVNWNPESRTLSMRVVDPETVEMMIREKATAGGMEVSSPRPGELSIHRPGTRESYTVRMEEIVSRGNVPRVALLDHPNVAGTMRLLSHSYARTSGRNGEEHYNEWRQLIELADRSIAHHYIHNLSFSPELTRARQMMERLGTLVPGREGMRQEEFEQTVFQVLQGLEAVRAHLSVPTELALNMVTTPPSSSVEHEALLNRAGVHPDEPSAAQLYSLFSQARNHLEISEHPQFESVVQTLVEQAKSEMRQDTDSARRSSLERGLTGFLRANGRNENGQRVARANTETAPINLVREVPAEQTIERRRQLARDVSADPRAAERVAQVSVEDRNELLRQIRQGEITSVDQAIAFLDHPEKTREEVTQVRRRGPPPLPQQNLEGRFHEAMTNLPDRMREPLRRLYQEGRVSVGGVEAVVEEMPRLMHLASEMGMAPSAGREEAILFDRLCVLLSAGAVPEFIADYETFPEQGIRDLILHLQNAAQNSQGVILPPPSNMPHVGEVRPASLGPVPQIAETAHDEIIAALDAWNPDADYAAAAHTPDPLASAHTPGATRANISGEMAGSFDAMPDPAGLSPNERRMRHEPDLGMIPNAGGRIGGESAHTTNFSEAARTADPLSEAGRERTASFVRLSELAQRFSGSRVETVSTPIQVNDQWTVPSHQARVSEAWVQAYCRASGLPVRRDAQGRTTLPAGMSFVIAHPAIIEALYSALGRRDMALIHGNETIEHYRPIPADEDVRIEVTVRNVRGNSATVTRRLFSARTGELLLKADSIFTARESLGLPDSLPSTSGEAPVISQQEIGAYAEASGDHQQIHLEQGIVHGMLIFNRADAQMPDTNPPCRLRMNFKNPLRAGEAVHHENSGRITSVRNAQGVVVADMIRAPIVIPAETRVAAPVPAPTGTVNTLGPTRGNVFHEMANPFDAVQDSGDPSVIARRLANEPDVRANPDAGSGRTQVDATPEFAEAARTSDPLSERPPSVRLSDFLAEEDVSEEADEGFRPTLPSPARYSSQGESWRAQHLNPIFSSGQTLPEQARRIVNAIMSVPHATAEHHQMGIEAIRSLVGLDPNVRMSRLIDLMQHSEIPVAEVERFLNEVDRTPHLSARTRSEAHYMLQINHDLYRRQRVMQIFAEYQRLASGDAVLSQALASWEHSVPRIGKLIPHLLAAYAREEMVAQGLTPDISWFTPQYGFHTCEAYPSEVVPLETLRDFARAAVSFHRTGQGNFTNRDPLYPFLLVPADGQMHFFLGQRPNLIDALQNITHNMRAYPQVMGALAGPLFHNKVRLQSRMGNDGEPVYLRMERGRYEYDTGMEMTLSGTDDLLRPDSFFAKAGIHFQTAEDGSVVLRVVNLQGAYRDEKAPHPFEQEAYRELFGNVNATRLLMANVFAFAQNLRERGVRVSRVDVIREEAQMGYRDLLSYNPHRSGERRMSPYEDFARRFGFASDRNQPDYVSLHLPQSPDEMVALINRGLGEEAAGNFWSHMLPAMDQVATVRARIPRGTTSLGRQPFHSPTFQRLGERGMAQLEGERVRVREQEQSRANERHTRSIETDQASAARNHRWRLEHPGQNPQATIVSLGRVQTPDTNTAQSYHQSLEAHLTAQGYTVERSGDENTYELRISREGQEVARLRRMFAADNGFKRMTWVENRGDPAVIDTVLSHEAEFARSNRMYVDANFTRHPEQQQVFERHYPGAITGLARRRAFALAGTPLEDSGVRNRPNTPKRRTANAERPLVENDYAQAARTTDPLGETSPVSRSDETEVQDSVPVREGFFSRFQLPQHTHSLVAGLGAMLTYGRDALGNALSAQEAAVAIGAGALVLLGSTALAVAVALKLRANNQRQNSLRGNNLQQTRVQSHPRVEMPAVQVPVHVGPVDRRTQPFESQLDAQSHSVLTEEINAAQTGRRAINMDRLINEVLIPQVQEHFAEAGDFASLVTQGIDPRHIVGEDAIGHYQYSNVAGLRVTTMLVSDGMGGHGNGDVAAQLSLSAFNTELRRSGNEDQAWALANAAVNYFNHALRSAGDVSEARRAAEEFIQRGQIPAELQAVSRGGSGACAASFSVVAPSAAGMPYVLHTRFAGDAAVRVFRKDAQGNWRRIYATREEGMGAIQADAQQISAGRTMMIRMNDSANVVTNGLGTQGFRMRHTQDGEVAVSNNEVRVAREYENGIALQEGDLVLGGSDGLWENFFSSDEVAQLIRHCESSGAAVRVLGVEAHRRMEVVRQLKAGLLQACPENPSRRMFERDGVTYYIDSNRRVYGSPHAQQPLTVFKADNFSLAAYLHSPTRQAAFQSRSGRNADATMMIDPRGNRNHISDDAATLPLQTRSTPTRIMASPPVAPVAQGTRVDTASLQALPINQTYVLSVGGRDSTQLGRSSEGYLMVRDLGPFRTWIQRANQRNFERPQPMIDCHLQPGDTIILGSSPQEAQAQRFQVRWVDNAWLVVNLSDSAYAQAARSDVDDLVRRPPRH